MTFIKDIHYNELTFTIDPYSEDAADLLAAFLGEIGFESFEPTDHGVKGYIQQSLYNQSLLDGIIETIPMAVSISFECQKIASVNWNKEWEKNYFKPIVIEDQCVIHSSFHTDYPQAKYDLVIDPKMSFGTGYHQTTWLMLREVLRANVEGMAVLDMGCGTAVIAILAAKKGAQQVTAIDIDPWCAENAAENIALNQTPSIEIILGGAEQLGRQPFDLIFANINRNILLEDMKHYVKVLKQGGTLYISGFYTEDLATLEQCATALHLRLIGSESRENWCCARFKLIYNY